MSSDRDDDQKYAEFQKKNFGLIEQMLQGMLADPDILDEIPNNAMLIVMPTADPESDRWRANHRRFYKYQTLSPHFPETIAPEPGDLRIVYDRDRDILLVD